MSLTTRVAISSFDDVIGSLELNVPEAASAQVAWSRVHQRCAVMGLFDDAGTALDVRADVLARLTGLFARPVSAGALRLMFPDADTSTGSVLLDVRVGTPVSALVATNVLDLLVAGVSVVDSDIKDALWLLLDALALPTGAVQVRRLVMVPEFPGDAVFAPFALFQYPDGTGDSVSWERALMSMPAAGVISSSIAALSSELAERSERESAMLGKPVLLTEALVPL